MELEDEYIESREEYLDKAAEINKLIVGTFETELGKKCLEHLEDVFVDRQIAKPGMSELEIGIRQGEANVIKKIIKEVRNG